MTRKEITTELSRLTEALIANDNDTRIYWAREVTFDYSTAHKIRVDYMRFKPLNNSVSGIEKGDFYCYEIKSSVEDFNSKNGHNFIGDYNYYIMPYDVYDKIKMQLPHSVGVYCPDNNTFKRLNSVKVARRTNRTRPTSEMLLMMFRSAARDREKVNRYEYNTNNL